MPASPCGTGCRTAPVATAGTLRVVLRCVLVVALLLVFPLLLAGRVLPAPGRRAAARIGARGMLAALGIGLDQRGDRPAESGVGTLVVANHVSWTDILVLAACFPCRFVARADLVDWPVLGLLARVVKVIPIARDRLRALPDTVDEVADALRGGATVVVFPEGTTWCGTAYGRFRPALFQAAIETGATVRPVGIAYRERTGAPSTATAFVGAEGIGESMSRILRLRGVRAEVVTGADLDAVGGDRRELARRAESVVRREADVAEIPPLRVTSHRRPAVADAHHEDRHSADVLRAG